MATSPEYEAAETRLMNALRSYTSAYESRIPGAMDFYAAQKLRNPDLPDPTANSKWSELGKPADQRSANKTIEDCTGWLDLGITMYRIATDLLLAGDSAGADEAAAWGSFARMQAVACAQLVLSV